MADPHLQGENMDTVEEQLLAYSARDLERFIATYSTDIIIEDGENNLIMRGHDQMREMYGALFRANPELHCRIANRMRIGKYVVDEEEVTGVGGSPTPMHAVVIYRIEGDKIVHVHTLT
jgi:hypothetical protein